MYAFLFHFGFRHKIVFQQVKALRFTRQRKVSVVLVTNLGQVLFPSIDQGVRRASTLVQVKQNVLFFHLVGIDVKLVPVLSVSTVPPVMTADRVSPVHENVHQTVSFLTTLNLFQFLLDLFQLLVDCLGLSVDVLLLGKFLLPTFDVWGQLTALLQLLWKYVKGVTLPLQHVLLTPKPCDYFAVRSRLFSVLLHKTVQVNRKVKWQLIFVFQRLLFLRIVPRPVYVKVYVFWHLPYVTVFLRLYLFLLLLTVDLHFVVELLVKGLLQVSMRRVYDNSHKIRLDFFRVFNVVDLACKLNFLPLK